MLQPYQIQRIAENLCNAQGHSPYNIVNGVAAWQVYEEEVKRIAFIIEQVELAKLGML